MADTGAKYPGSGTNDASVGTVAWSNPGNITADDGSYAQVTNLQIGSNAIDNAVRIVKSDGSIGSENKASVANWPSSFAYTSYGGSSDLWGETWTPDDINDTNFGAVIVAQVESNVSNYLVASDFGFSIPSEATIDGILVEINKTRFINGIDQVSPRVDTIRITVYYTLPPPEPTFLKQQNGRLLYQQSGRGILL